MPIKSFRGKLVDGETETIVLHTNTGETGYKIVKFNLMPLDSDEDIESTVKVYSINTAATATIDFSDNTLLAAGIIRAGTGVSQPLTHITVFDNVIFNQDIFITLKGGSYTRDVNWYIELEQRKLDLAESTTATLRNIRNIAE